MNDIMKIVQALEDSNILLKEVCKKIKNETKEQRGGFLSMLLGTLGASLLGNLLTGKGIVRAGTGSRSLNSSTSYENKNGKGIVRAGIGNRSLNSSTSYGNKKGKIIVRAGTGNRSLNCSTSYENKKEWYF